MDVTIKDHELGRTRGRRDKESKFRPRGPLLTSEQVLSPPTASAFGRTADQIDYLTLLTIMMVSFFNQFGLTAISINHPSQIFFSFNSFKIYRWQALSYS